MKRKKLISTILAAALMVSFTACSSAATSGQGGGSASADESAQTSQQSSKRIKVGYCVSDLSNTYFVEVANAFKKEAEATGVDAAIVDGKNDTSTQISAIENFITQKVDVIACAPVDAKSMEPLVEKAHQAGIKFIASAQEIKGYDVFVTVPDYDYGYAGGTLAGKWMKQHLSGSVEVAIIDHPQLQQLIERSSGLEKGIMEQYPDAKIVAHQDAATAEQGMKAAETIMQAHPNVKIISCINDDIALGAMEAVKSMNKASDDFGIFGLDATPHALSTLKENGIFRGTINSQPDQTGKKILDNAVKLAKNESISDKIVGAEMLEVTQ